MADVAIGATGTWNRDDVDSLHAKGGADPSRVAAGGAAVPVTTLDTEAGEVAALVSVLPA